MRKWKLRVYGIGEEAATELEDVERVLTAMEQPQQRRRSTTDRYGGTC
jgi:hypothetical protein